jgi:hypothetical protein
MHAALIHADSKKMPHHHVRPDLESRKPVSNGYKERCHDTPCQYQLISYPREFYAKTMVVCVEVNLALILLGA